MEIKQRNVRISKFNLTSDKGNLPYGNIFVISHGLPGNKYLHSVEINSWKIHMKNKKKYYWIIKITATYIIALGPKNHSRLLFPILRTIKEMIMHIFYKRLELQG